MPKPLVLVDLWPRRRTMVFTDEQWARLEAMADVTSSASKPDNMPCRPF